MKSFLFAIDKSNPEHWSYAVREGIWDTKKQLRQDPVEPGDLMYFWQSGDGIVGVASATSAMYGRGSAPMPWNITDDKRDEYTYRIDLSPIQSGSATSLTWNEIATETGTPALQTPRHVPRNQEWLAEKVLGRSKAEKLFDELLQSVSTEPSALDETTDGVGAIYGPVPNEDTRRKTLRAIHVRQGQPDFATFSWRTTRADVQSPAAPRKRCWMQLTSRRTGGLMRMSRTTGSFFARTFTRSSTSTS